MHDRRRRQYQAIRNNQQLDKRKRWRRPLSNIRFKNRKVKSSDGEADLSHPSENEDKIELLLLIL